MREKGEPSMKALPGALLLVLSLPAAVSRLVCE
jgi:hypothetical protein